MSALRFALMITLLVPIVSRAASPVSLAPVEMQQPVREVLIMTTIPLGVASGLLGLALMNAVGISQPFDMISMLGFLILMGTVVNNPILIVHQATDNLRAGQNAAQAVSEAVATRLRPIAMTTITTVCGLAPLVLIPGEGTELYRGVGAIVLFGLLGSAIVTVTFLAALTALVLRARQPART